MKDARDRKGIALAEIANTTKVPAFLFEGLERNDLSRWPKGLFRRSFFRDYARTIGVPLAEACAEFVRLFPDDDSPEVVKAAAAANQVPIARRHSLFDALARGMAIVAAQRRHWADAIRHMFDSANSAAPEPTEEPNRGEWATDARRVKSAPSPRIRVRIKSPS